MDANHVLLFLAVFSAVSSIIRVMNLRTAARGFGVVAILILLAIGICELIAPDIAGFVGGGLWLSLLIVPSLLVRRVSQLRAARQFRRARRLTSFARLLHPMDGWWHTPRLLLALELIDRGEDEAAIEQLIPLSALSRPIGPQANALLFSVRHQWPELIAWVDETMTPAAVASTGLASSYLKALGESGALSKMVATYERLSPTLHDAAFARLRRQCRQLIFVYCGRVNALCCLLGDGRTPLLPEHREYSIARCELAAGDRAAAEARLEALEKYCSPETKKRITRIREADPVPASDRLTEDDIAALGRIERSCAEEHRYSSPTLSRSKAIVTALLAVACLVVFAIECTNGGSTDGATLYRMGAVYAPAIRAGQYWRLVAANFLHVGPIHLGMNLLALIVLGPFVEWSLGWFRYLMLYMLSGVGAFLIVTQLQQWHTTDASMVVGASGAIMGLVGATGAILLRGWLSDRAPAAVQRLRIVLLIVGFQVIFDCCTPQVSSSAHIAGVLIGFILALPFKSRVIAPTDQPAAPRPVLEEAPVVS